MVFVDADTIEAEFIGQLQLGNVPSEIFANSFGITELIIRRRDPDTVVAFVEIRRQVAITLHMERNCLHPRLPPEVRTRRSPIRSRAETFYPQPLRPI